MPATLLTLIVLGAAPSGVPDEVGPTAVDAGAAHVEEAPSAAPARRRLRLPELTPEAIWTFARFGAGLFWEVTRDNPWTFALVTAAGVAAGVLGCGALGGVAGAAVALALYLSGVLTTWPLVFVVAGPLLVSAVLGLVPGTCGGVALGFWASIDDGELALPLGSSLRRPPPEHRRTRASPAMRSPAMLF